jgi:hypothetical protein
MGDISGPFYTLWWATSSNWTEFFWLVQYYFRPNRNGRNSVRFGPFGPNPRTMVVTSKCSPMKAYRSRLFQEEAKVMKWGPPSESSLKERDRYGEGRSLHADGSEPMTARHPGPGANLLQLATKTRQGWMKQPFLFEYQIYDIRFKIV